VKRKRGEGDRETKVQEKRGDRGRVRGTTKTVDCQEKGGFMFLGAGGGGLGEE